VENGESQPRSKPVEVDGVDEDVPEEVASKPGVLKGGGGKKSTIYTLWLCQNSY